MNFFFFAKIDSQNQGVQKSLDALRGQVGTLHGGRLGVQALHDSNTDMMDMRMLDNSEPVHLNALWANAWEALVENHAETETKRSKKTSMKRRYNETAWSTWKGIKNVRYNQS